jgi:hypothetical protein
MKMWLRQASLVLGQNKYTIDGLNFAFKVMFEDRAKVSTATLEVHNLSPSTRASMKKGDTVIITAGYKGDVGSIFVGAIADYSHTDDGLDIITKITAADSLEAWLGASINKTYKAGMYASDIIDDLLNIFGVEVGMVKLAINKHYPGCRVCRGKLKDVLTEIVVSDCKSRLVIRCGQIIINPPNEGINSGYVLSPQTGLLKASSQKESQTVNTKTTATTKTRSEQTEDDGTIQRSCLLNYHIGVADKIVIQDGKVNGTFLVLSGVHEGSRDGDWKTTLEVKPA